MMPAENCISHNAPEGARVVKTPSPAMLSEAEIEPEDACMRSKVTGTEQPKDRYETVLPVGASNLTMQCAQIQINHYHAGLWTGHDFHPQFPSFATCSKDLMMTTAPKVTVTPQESVTFEDVAVYFTKQEWDSLTLAQKNHYKDAMLENFAHVEFLEPSTSKPALITQLEQGEEPGFSQPKGHEQ